MAGTLVVLDWSGGASSLVSGRELAGFSVDSLLMTDVPSNGNELAEAFRQAVLARVQVILCDLEPADIAVVEGDAEDFLDATVVYITGDEPAGEAKHIGQSKYDACNTNAADEAIVWGGAIATRVGAAAFDEWVNAIANTAAHEVGHTLGFVHPTEEIVGSPLPLPADELMRADVTVSDLLMERWFVIEQDTCPEDPEQSYHLADGNP